MESLKLPNIINPLEFKNTFLDISEDEYRADLTAANFSTLKYMLKSPASYLYNLQNPKEQTKAMKYGTIAHMALLESEKFKSRYVVEPIFEGLTAKGEKTTSKNATDVKRQYEEWRHGLDKDAVILDQTQFDSLVGVINSMSGNQKLLALIKNGVPEVVGKWVDPDTGIICKMKADLWVKTEHWNLDFKTTGKSAEWEIFRKSVESLHYDMQIAMYNEGFYEITGKKIQHSGWVVPETFGPWESEIFLAHDLFLEVGLWKFKTCLKRLKKCIEKNSFPQRNAEIDIQMPEPSPWYFKSYEGVMNHE